MNILVGQVFAVATVVVNWFVSALGLRRVVDHVVALIVEEGGASDLLFYGLAREVLLFGIWPEYCSVSMLSKFSYFRRPLAKVFVGQKMQRLDSSRIIKQIGYRIIICKFTWCSYSAIFLKNWRRHIKLSRHGSRIETFSRGLSLLD